MTDNTEHWTYYGITMHQGKYLAWDETEAGCIGTFDTREEAVDALTKYGEALAADYESDPLNR